METYDFDNDAEFRSGLEMVLAKLSDSASEQDRQRARQQARHFYYQKSDQTSSELPYPKTFHEVMELVLAGKEVPGIQTIPDHILSTDTPREAALAPRKKPWES
ncbi:hypothetical protein RI367_002536 [Sorochytrium milnesiophthora]